MAPFFVMPSYLISNSHLTLPHLWLWLGENGSGGTTAVKEGGQQHPPSPLTLLRHHHGLLRSQVINIKGAPYPCWRHSQSLSVRKHPSSELYWFTVTAAMWKDSCNGKNSLMLHRCEENLRLEQIREDKNVFICSKVQPRLSLVMLFVVIIKNAHP